MGFLPPTGEEMDGVCSLKISSFLDNLLSALQQLFSEGEDVSGCLPAKIKLCSFETVSE